MCLGVCVFSIDGGPAACAWLTNWETQISLPTIPSHPPDLHHNLRSAALALHQPFPLLPTSPKSHPWLVRGGGIIFHCQGWQRTHTGTITSQASDIGPATPSSISFPSCPICHNLCSHSTCWCFYHKIKHRVLLVMNEDTCWVTEAWYGRNRVQLLPGNMRQQAVNITQLVLAEHSQGWAANRASPGQMRELSGPVRHKSPPIPPFSSPLAVLPMVYCGASVSHAPSVLKPELWLQCISILANIKWTLALMPLWLGSLTCGYLQPKGALQQSTNALL